jgi:hypothetical protein
VKNPDDGYFFIDIDIPPDGRLHNASSSSSENGDDDGDFGDETDEDFMENNRARIAFGDRGSRHHDGTGVESTREVERPRPVPVTGDDVMRIVGDLPPAVAANTPSPRLQRQQQQQQQGRNAFPVETSSSSKAGGGGGGSSGTSATSRLPVDHSPSVSSPSSPGHYRLPHDAERSSSTAKPLPYTRNVVRQQQTMVSSTSTPVADRTAGEAVASSPPLRLITGPSGQSQPNRNSEGEPLVTYRPEGNSKVLLDGTDNEKQDSYGESGDNDDYADYEQQSLYRVVKTTLSTWLVVGVVLASVVLVVLVALLVAYKSGRRHHYGNGTGGGGGLRWIRDCTSRLVGSSSLRGPNNCGSGGNGRHCADDDDHESPPSGRPRSDARKSTDNGVYAPPEITSLPDEDVQAGGRTTEPTPCKKQQQTKGAAGRNGVVEWYV